MTKKKRFRKSVSIKLEEEVFDYISQSLLHGASYKEIERTLLNEGVPVSVVNRSISQAKAKGKLLVPKSLFFTILVFSIVVLLALTTLLVFIFSDTPCVVDAQCPGGFECSAGACINVVGSLECETLLESDGSRGTDYYRCVSDL